VLFLNGEDQIFISPRGVFINMELVPSFIFQTKPTIWSTSLGAVSCIDGIWFNDYLVVNETKIEPLNSFQAVLREEEQ
jgi:hypothetical protein